MKNEETRRFGLLTCLTILLFVSLFIMNKFDSGLYKNLNSNSDIISCVYSEITSSRGGHYWIDLRVPENSTNAVINVHKTDSELTNENVQCYSVSSDILKVTGQIIDLYNMRSWKMQTNTDLDDDYSSASVLIRYSDGSTLYINDCNLTEMQREEFYEIKKTILKYTTNENSGLSIEKKSKQWSYEAQNQISIRPEFIDNGYLTIYVTNHSGSPKSYSTDFKLEFLEKGSWKTLERLDDYKTDEPTDIFISDMQIVSHVLDLNVYGKLRHGDYRITISNDMSEEFIIK